MLTLVSVTFVSRSKAKAENAAAHLNIISALGRDRIHQTCALNGSCRAICPRASVNTHTCKNTHTSQSHRQSASRQQPMRRVCNAGCYAHLTIQFRCVQFILLGLTNCLGHSWMFECVCDALCERINHVDGGWPYLYSVYLHVHSLKRKQLCVHIRTHPLRSDCMSIACIPKCIFYISISSKCILTAIPRKKYLICRWVK